MPTVLAMLLLLSCSAMPGLASLRHDQTTTAHVTVLASQSGARRAATGAITPDQESTRSPTRPPLRLTVAMRPGAFAAGAATALGRASGAAPFGNNVPRSDRAVSLAGPGPEVWARRVLGPAIGPHWLVSCRSCIDLSSRLPHMPPDIEVSTLRSHPASLCLLPVAVGCNSLDQ